MAVGEQGMRWVLTRARHGGGSATDPDAATTRRVGWRLAALTVGLIVALLVVLGATVYTTMDNVLLQSLRATVVQRTATFMPSMQGQGFHQGPGSQQPGPGPQQSHGPAPRQRHVPSSIGEVRFVTADQTLHVLPSPDPDAPATLPDQSAARRVLTHHLTSVWSVQQVDATGPYLIYTVPVQLSEQNGSTTTGVVQASVSEQQYQGALHTLIEVLAGVSVLGILAAAAISGVLARRALQPIHLALRRQRDFVADAAHELRTPLAIQRTAMELGLGADALDAQQSAIEQALSQNVHLARLVDSLSLLARADSGAVTLERGPVDLARLAVEAGNGVEILAEERDVRLRVEAQRETWVTGDAGRLRQVLLILLDNALKFTPDHGAITVRVERRDGQARLEVRDSGPGIAAADLPHLFDRFYRADKARGSGGTGLGLAIGRWIAEAHGGRITAANAPGGGALFAVTLPLAQGS